MFLTGAGESGGGGEEARTKGVSFRGGGEAAGGEEGRRSVMREDSWQVQRRLTAKPRWQRGKTEELGRGVGVRRISRPALFPF